MTSQPSNVLILDSGGRRDEAGAAPLRSSARAAVDLASLPPPAHPPPAPAPGAQSLQSSCSATRRSRACPSMSHSSCPAKTCRERPARRAPLPRFAVPASPRRPRPPAHPSPPSRLAAASAYATNTAAAPHASGPAPAAPQTANRRRSLRPPRRMDVLYRAPTNQLTCSSRIPSVPSSVRTAGTCCTALWPAS